MRSSHVWGGLQSPDGDEDDCPGCEKGKCVGKESGYAECNCKKRHCYVCCAPGSCTLSYVDGKLKEQLGESQECQPDPPVAMIAERSG